MTEQNQHIEKMAEIMTEHAIRTNRITLTGFDLETTRARYAEIMREYAKDLYDAGCRFQTEGEWVRQKGRPEAICSNCGREVEYQVIDNRWRFENFCPHCGMKAKET